MNYLRELNAFDDWLETNHLCPSGISLWFALMQTANKAGWPHQFTVPISVLERKTGLKTQTVYEARKKLEKAGRIRWTSRRGSQCAIYEMISCDIIQYHDVQIETNDTIETSTQPQMQPQIQPPIQPPMQSPIQPQMQSPIQPQSINKLNETKQDETKQDETNSSLLCQNKSNPKSVSPTKKISIPMKTYGEFDNVKLTDEEHEKLIAKFGEYGCKEHICKLSEYIASKNVRYQSHYATILSWSRKDQAPKGDEGKAEPKKRAISDFSKFHPIDF